MKQSLAKSLILIIGFFALQPVARANEIVDSLLTKQINSMQKLANWMIAYDRFAWATSDSVANATLEEKSRLGREWFCYNDSNNIWHAVYGKYDANEYQIGVHYIFDSETRGIRKVQDSPDLLLSISFAHAINSAYKQLEADSALKRIRFNHYIRKEDDGKFLVWILPGTQLDGTMLYGKEYHYQFDTDCETLLSKNVVNGPLMGIAPNPSKSLTMNYSQMEAPSLGAIFFASNCSKLFRDVYIKTKHHLHSFRDGVWKSVRID